VHEEAWLDLPDMGTRLLYSPCTVVALTGKVLCHGVRNWIGGERICVAHFVRDNVHNRLKLCCPDWVTNERYLDLMDAGFVTRHGWTRH
jgi:hypothetical protein